ncbi:MAG: DUF1800 family protein [Rhodoferax sp.]
MAHATTGPGAFSVGGQHFSVAPCAAEGESCGFLGQQSVAYGVNGRWVVKALIGPVACNNATFGDPVRGVSKACYLSSDGGSTPPAPVPQACAAQTLRWTVGSQSCAADVAQTPSGQTVNLVDARPSVTGTAQFACVNAVWGAPQQAVCQVGSMLTPAQTDAARLLIQASFGPTEAEIDRVAAMGPEAWLQQQLSTPSMDTHWDYVMVRKGPVGCTVCDAKYINAVMESFWQQAVRGPDQLRQRMVFALSELFVVSTVNSPVSTQEYAHASYLDMLSRHAFGNFRDLLEAVSTHPTMAHYLSHMRNDKEDPVSGRLPDENYAREVMQLFTIGLWQLNEDGSRKKDTQGRDIPTFTQADVMGLAKVFTGLSWAGPDTENGRWMGWRDRPWNQPLQHYPQHHSSSEKRFLGVTVPANTPGPESLKIALDTLFNHPNVGPFLGKQLIQRLVTSNPSPAYVARVARAFNNSQGVRGDMKAVLRAVLLDPEARDPARAAQADWGKLREPILRFSAWLRAFDAKTARQGYRFAIWNLEDPVSSIGQNPLRAPSVFNWFRPDFAPQGDLADRGLVAPEFQITHDTTVTGYANFVVNLVERGFGWNETRLVPDYSAELALADDPIALLNRLDKVLLAGQLSPETRGTVLAALGSLPASNPAKRVQTAVALLMLSPDFMVQK